MSTENLNTHSDPADEPGAEPATEQTPRSERDDAWRWTRLKLTILVLLLIFVYLIPDIFYKVGSGEAAVVWYLFAGGTDVQDVRGEGLRVKWPWDRVYIYDIRLREETRTFPALSNDGLPIEVEVSIRFRVHKDSLGQLHKNVGPDYVDRLIVPELGAHVREQISHYRPAELYAVRRAEIQSNILAALESELQLDYDVGEPEQLAIHVEDVLIRNLTLPATVEAAIESKLAQEQHMLEYDYRLQKEEKERERKKIEAEGIRQFQDIVAEGISERYLKWKGIDATLELARSPNAKIVVIGAGDDGLPIILGGLDALPQAAVPAPPGEPPQAAPGAPAGQPPQTAPGAPGGQPPPP